MDQEPCELDQPVWAVITTKGVFMAGLYYQAARVSLQMANNQGYDGPTLVTNEVADRLLGVSNDEVKKA